MTRQNERQNEQSAAGFDAPLLICDDHGNYRRATADQILEAARHAIEHKTQRGASFESPQAVKEYLLTKLAGLECEVFAALFLDGEGRLIDYVELSRGTLNSAAVYPREVVKEALRRNASAVILSHNHPSGLPDPSQQDLAVTAMLKMALATVDVMVVDHVIVGGAHTYSFVEHRLL
ncbi:RadC family protein [Variovorax sp. KK3]|uniref:JAB domain-containing protein n=1 Tax=Variovorax sp. KK3 TaxID=1855728 RepID=UPI00097BAF93|nr:DNA repair protein RadC [Variovorax sp. KK3]